MPVTSSCGSGWGSRCISANRQRVLGEWETGDLCLSVSYSNRGALRSFQPESSRTRFARRAVNYESRSSRLRKSRRVVLTFILSNAFYLWVTECRHSFPRKEDCGYWCSMCQIRKGISFPSFHQTTSAASAPPTVRSGSTRRSNTHIWVIRFPNDVSACAWWPRCWWKSAKDGRREESISAQKTS